MRMNKCAFLSAVGVAFGLGLLLASSFQTYRLGMLTAAVLLVLLGRFSLLR